MALRGESGKGDGIRGEGESVKNDGGPAFPAFISGHTAVDLVNFNSTSGLSLRDYFAVHASDADIDAVLDEKGKVGFKVWRSQARYIFADAMLYARNCEGGGIDGMTSAAMLAERSKP